MKTPLLWLLWSIGTLALAAVVVGRLYVGGDRTAFLPGQTAGVHHQLEISCETCHTAPAFASQKKVNKSINKTCTSCHKDELKEADDSHPIKKFKNPRMAAYWDRIDARFCTSCHSEHEPEITLAGLVTLPGDLCIACHSEGDQDVRVNRATHADLEFDTCASAGCHNYHDNRALYEDFLVKHADAPDLHAAAIHEPAVLARARARPMVEDLEAMLAKLQAPEAATGTEADHHWAASGHAVADVTCASCHAPGATTEEEIDAAWIDAPGEQVCASCHKPQAKTFALGRHGMRRHPEIAKPRSAKKSLKEMGWKKPPETVVTLLETYLADAAPPPMMSTAEARVSLVDHPHSRDLTCATCHAPHEVDVAYAAVEACLTCHDDNHSKAYKSSAHFALFEAEKAGSAAPGTGVSCATCHMPQTARKGVATTNHNQNDTLRPNEKMIRPVCQSCHGLAYAIDALADETLIEENFSHPPSRHIESIDWAVSRVDQPDEGANQ